MKLPPVEPCAELRAQVAKFPKEPGTYIMKDSSGQVIYVGKAKSLRARVTSYFTGQDERAQIGFLLRRIATIETIVTETEHQALILERDLITKYKPRYNIRLKDDKAYLSIRLDQNAEWPRLELVRRVEDDGARYFGPYANGYELRQALEVIKRSIPLRTCQDTVLYNRQRPCLEYEIKRCSAPCCGKVQQEQYRAYVQQAVAVLQGRNQDVIKQLTRDMDAAAEDMRFEDAAALRDRIDVLTNIVTDRHIVTPGGENRDVVALYREGQLGVLVILQVRNGRIIATNNFPLHDLVMPDDEVIGAGLSQFYATDRGLPDEVILPQEVSGVELLVNRAGESRVTVVVPQKGVKYRLLQLAELNAKQSYLSRFEADARNTALARDLATLCRLSQVPRRIECVDISNLQGSDIVAAVVSFFDGEPDKQAYRRYKIRSQGKPDDFASIHEVVQRRIARGLDEHSLPDLMIIDGGPAQLAKAIEARASLAAKVDIISLAKLRTLRGGKGQKPERIYLEGVEDPIPLATDSPLTQLLQRIRDEAHRFAITFHRERRKKRILRSELDDIPGLPPAARQRLLRHFGSPARIAESPVAEIAKVAKIPLERAETLREQLQRS